MILSDNAKQPCELRAIYHFISDSRFQYPQISKWYSNKVIHGLISGERKILTEFRNGRMVGVAILKNTSYEKKICTLKICKDMKNSGLGVRLFKRSFQELGTCSPLVTVSEDKLQDFERIFKYFDFKLVQKLNGYYNKNKYEFVYNHFLDHGELRG